MLQAENEQKSEQRGRRVKLTIRVVAIGVVLIGAAFLYSVFVSSDDPTEEAQTTQTDGEAGEDGGDDGGGTDEGGSDGGADAGTDDGTDTGSDADTSDSTSGDDGAAAPATSAPANPTSNETCPAEDGSSPQTTQFIEAPPLCINTDQLYAADFVTTLGNFTMVLDPSLDADSVNNFVFLARYGAFNGTIFHRVISNFVIQGGDVANSFGTGSPGYQFTGRIPPDDWYRIGAVAMANSSNPSTNGSQFFVVTGSDGAGLPSLYSPLGVVTTGLDVVATIDAVPTQTRARPNGSSASDVPIEDVVVTSVTIRDATEEDQTAYAAS